MPIDGSLSTPAFAAVGSRPTVMRTVAWGFNSPAEANGTSISFSPPVPALTWMTLCSTVTLEWMKLAWCRTLSGVMKSPCDGLTRCRVENLCRLLYHSNNQESACYILKKKRITVYVSPCSQLRQSLQPVELQPTVVDASLSCSNQ